MKKTNHRRAQVRSSDSSLQHPSSPRQRGNGADGSVATPTPLTWSQAATLLRIAARATRDVRRRRRRSRGGTVSAGRLQQIAFLAALSSHRSFDPSRRVSYRAWVQSNAAAAVRDYLEDDHAPLVPAPAPNGRAHAQPNGRTPGLERVATPATVAMTSGLSIDLVRRLVSGNVGGFVLFFPGHNKGDQQATAGVAHRLARGDRRGD